MRTWQEKRSTEDLWAAQERWVEEVEQSAEWRREIVAGLSHLLAAADLLEDGQPIEDGFEKITDDMLAQAIDTLISDVVGLTTRTARDGRIIPALPKVEWVTLLNMWAGQI